MASNYYGAGAGNYDDETLNREALLAQMKQDQQAQQAAAPKKPVEAGGITGGGDVQSYRENAPAQTPDAAPAAEDYTQLGKYANRLGAFAGNTDKLNRGWDDKSERYKMLTVQSHFNPDEGITPAMIEALNKANIHGAKFSGDRDKLTVDNAGGWARFGKGGTGDIIQGFNDPNNKNKQWGAWQVDDNPAPAAPAGGGMFSNMFAGSSSLANALRGAGNVPTDENTYNILQQQLEGILGPAATDRNALLALMRQ